MNQDLNNSISEIEPTLSPPEGAIPIDNNIDFLSPIMQEGLKAAGWNTLFPVQAKAIPYMLAGKELLVRSHTGSGKTGAFVIPLLEVVQEDHLFPQALILVPTRELAEQVHTEIKRLSFGRDIRSVAIYGGVGYDQQINALRGGVHIIVATPGRLLDHIQRGNVDFLSLRDLVMDEADEMLSMGFYPDMRKIRGYLPKKYCTTLFSATIPQTVKSLAREFQHSEAVSICMVQEKSNSADNLEHYYYVIDAMDKDSLLVQILEYENPQSCIIFCNMKKDVHYLGEVLNLQGLKVGVLAGDITQKQRQKTLDFFREGEYKILIATDVAARGIDISHVSHVILYDHPESADVYVHRSGRTARAGKAGVAISLVTPVEELELKKTSSQHGIPFIKRQRIDVEVLNERIRTRLITFLEREKRGLPKSIKEKLPRFLPLVNSLSQVEDEKELLAYLLHQFYQKKLLEPEV